MFIPFNVQNNFIYQILILQRYEFNFDTNQIIYKKFYAQSNQISENSSPYNLSPQIYRQYNSSQFIY